MLTEPRTKERVSAKESKPTSIGFH